eukprot:scaffold4528_cov86-Isochrysis_galbana.AAC.2
MEAWRSCREGGAARGRCRLRAACGTAAPPADMAWAQGRASLRRRWRRMWRVAGGWPGGAVGVRVANLPEGTEGGRLLHAHAVEPSMERIGRAESFVGGRAEA